MEIKSDTYYIGEVLKGDPGSFSPLVEKYKHLAFSLSMKIINRREEAEEAAQDAFIKAYKSLGSFRGSSSFKTWFFRIVYTTAISTVRALPKTEIKFDDLKVSEREVAETDNILGDLNSIDRSRILEEALSKLDPEERVLLNLCYYEDLSMEEIAIISGISVSNVKIKLYRSRKKLFQLLYFCLKNEVISII